MKKRVFAKTPCFLLICALCALLLTAAFCVYAEEGVGREAARNIALADAGLENAERLKTEYELEDGRYVYEVEFFAEGVEYEYHILAGDGTVLKKKEEFRLPAVSSGAPVSEREAALLAVTDAGFEEALAENAYAHEDRDDGRKEYKVLFVAEGFCYEYEIDAQTGFITERSREMTEEDDPASPYIGTGKAEEIALGHAKLSAGEVSFLKAQQDTEKGRAVYEVEFRAGGFEYEYEIDALTGDILNFEKERD